MFLYYGHHLFICKTASGDFRGSSPRDRDVRDILLGFRTAFGQSGGIRGPRYRMLRQLTLLRHAKAVPFEDDAGDFDRALAERGLSDAAAMGPRLADAGVAPEVVLVSTALRTRQTWDQISATFPNADVRFVRTLYLAPAEMLRIEALRAGAERVMIVAHNPGLQDLACHFARGESPLDQLVRAKYPTCAASLFERRAEDGDWKLRAFLTPKDV